MGIRNIILGLLSLTAGLFLWAIVAAATAFREGFGGDDVSVAWFVVPVVLTFGGPALFWWYLPSRRRKRLGVAKHGDKND
jgi:uncharacterized BrkB/YihY/UPF0761 family membrane protein